MSAQWQTIKLQNVADLIMGQSPKSSTYNKNGAGLPFYQGKADFGSVYPKERMYCSEPIKIAEKDDILISVRAPVGALNLSFGKSCIGRGLAAIRAKKINYLFLYYQLKLLEKKIEAMGVGSTFKSINKNVLANMDLSVPESEKEQQTIAIILSKIQEATENQEKIIKTTTELKTALMKKLFSEGLNGEELKETEIGKTPKSWEIKNIKDLVFEAKTRNPGKQPEKIIKYIDVSSVSNQLLKIVEPQILKGKDAPGRARKVVLTDDVIFATVRPTLRRVCKIPSEYNDEYCSTAFCVLRSDPSVLDYEFLFQYLSSNNFIKRTEKFQSGANYPAITDEKLKAMEIPLPPLNEQKKISNILRLIDDKFYITYKKNQVNQKLFHSMLNNLMSGEIRVNNLTL